MPFFAMDVNKSIEKQDCEGIMKRSADLLAQLLNKPTGGVFVVLNPEANLLMGDTTGTTVFAELKSIGFPEDRAPELIAALTEFFVKEFGAPPERQYIELTNLNGAMYGWNGKACG